MKILINKLKNQPKHVLIGLCIFLLLVLYTASLFFYLQIVGVYGVAVIKEEVVSSEGVIIKYEFFYEEEKYEGVFTAGKKYKIGDKYFVLFSKSNPSNNLLRYNSQVPDCLKDSIHSFWSTRPNCPPNYLTGASLSLYVDKPNDKYSDYTRKLENGDVNIDYKEFREAFIESTQFIIASKKQREIDSLGKEMFTNLGDSNFHQAIIEIKGILDIDYTNMMAHKKLSEAYESIGNISVSQKHKAILNGLLNSILENGDGKSCKTAWPVIQVTEEGFILQMLEAEIKNLEVGNRSGKCDIFEVEVDKKSATYYFETSKILEGYKKISFATGVPLRSSPPPVSSTSGEND